MSARPETSNVASSTQPRSSWVVARAITSMELHRLHTKLTRGFCFSQPSSCQLDCQLCLCKDSLGEGLTCMVSVWKTASGWECCVDTANVPLLLYSNSSRIEAATYKQHTSGSAKSPNHAATHQLCRENCSDRGAAVACRDAFNDL